MDNEDIIFGSFAFSDDSIFSGRSSFVDLKDKIAKKYPNILLKGDLDNILVEIDSNAIDFSLKLSDFVNMYSRSKITIQGNNIFMKRLIIDTNYFDEIHISLNNSFVFKTYAKIRESVSDITSNTVLTKVYKKFPDSCSVSHFANVLKMTTNTFAKGYLNSITI